MRFFQPVAPPRPLREADITVTDVSSVTGFPEIMDGRVKTLHPKIHGGLLARRDNEAHQAAMKAESIEGIDLLVVNLYPFEATLATTKDRTSLIENIDIGGPAMLRAAAKTMSLSLLPATQPIMPPSPVKFRQQEAPA